MLSRWKKKIKIKIKKIQNAIASATTEHRIVCPVISFTGIKWNKI